MNVEDNGGGVATIERPADVTEYNMHAQAMQRLADSALKVHNSDTFSPLIRAVYFGSALAFTVMAMYFRDQAEAKVKGVEALSINTVVTLWKTMVSLQGGNGE